MGVIRGSIDEGGWREGWRRGRIREAIRELGRGIGSWKGRLGRWRGGLVG